MDKNDLIRNLKMASPEELAPNSNSMVGCLRFNGGNSMFADDVHTVCSKCQHPIIHRPTSPPFRKVCMECVMQQVEDMPPEEQERVQSYVDPKQIPELMLMLMLQEMEPGEHGNA